MNPVRNILIAMLLLLVAVPSASGAWDYTSITVEPGETEQISLTNEENDNVALVVTNVSAVSPLLDYIYVFPDTVPPLTTKVITIQLISIPQSILADIPPDTYAVRIGDLIVYLDVGEADVVENLDARIDNLTAEFEAARDNHAALIAFFLALSDNMENTLDDKIAQVITSDNLEDSENELWVGISRVMTTAQDARKVLRNDFNNLLLAIGALIAVVLVLNRNNLGFKRPAIPAGLGKGGKKPPESSDNPASGLPKNPKPRKKRDYKIAEKPEKPAPKSEGELEEEADSEADLELENVL